MATTTIIQGRHVNGDDIRLIRDLCQEHPEWSRYRLSRELAIRWQWQNAKGQIKDMASRSLLRKLAARKLIALPPPRCRSPNHYRHQPVPEVLHDSQPVQTSLHAILPLRLLDISKSATVKLFSHLLARYHYLGYRQPVGENLQYLIGARDGRPLACLLFGAAAWKCAARDQFIGWDHGQRQRHLPMITNNQRFLILPWIRIECLASHILGFIARRISDDWQEKYGHPVVLLETFVDRSRFAGVCYRAANWQWVGKTTGRSRQDRHHRLTVPIKDVYLYPLKSKARERLCR